MDQPQPGDTFPVQMGWTLPGGTRLQVTFQARVEAMVVDKNRMRCRLLQVLAAGGNRPQAEMDPYYFEQVMGLIGRQAMIPLDAFQGIVLPLRLATLTGEHHYFFD